MVCYFLLPLERLLQVGPLHSSSPEPHLHQCTQYEYTESITQCTDNQHATANIQDITGTLVGYSLLNCHRGCTWLAWWWWGTIEPIVGPPHVTSTIASSIPPLHRYISCPFRLKRICRTQQLFCHPSPWKEIQRANCSICILKTT